MLSREATNTNSIVFGLTQLGFKLTTYHTQVEHATNKTTDAVSDKIDRDKLMHNQPSYEH
jgi:hypothetical protein